MNFKHSKIVHKNKNHIHFKGYFTDYSDHEENETTYLNDMEYKI